MAGKKQDGGEKRQESGRKDTRAGKKRGEREKDTAGRSHGCGKTTRWPYPHGELYLRASANLR